MPDAPLPLSNDAENPPPPSVLFYARHKRVLATVLDTRLDIGRQRSGEPAPARRIDRSESARIVLAPLDDVDVSRSHVGLQLVEQNPLRVEITNLSKSQPARLSPSEILHPLEARIVDVPCLVQFTSYAVRVEPPEEESLDLEPLPERTLAPGRQGLEPAGLGRLNIDTTDERLLLRWLETVLGVFQSAANSRDFPEQAAKALVKIVGLDAAAMLEYTEEGRWRTAALHSAAEGQDEETWVPSQTLLAQVLKEKRTYRHIPANVTDTAKSLQNVTALVAAPILDGEDNVIGALYGDRRSGARSDDVPEISQFEAKLVELLATGIAAGIARVKEEKAALAARVQFEQFFTPQLAAQLQRDPQLLTGREARITLLFADIRGFSSISERLGSARTMTWIQETMEVLSTCVLECEGVLVDYIGDELMAMWGAPIAQSDHAELALRAAEQMIQRLPEINARWEAELGTPVKIGIGLNSGIAHVGNTGSRQKFKYGPLGDTVNVASRVQGASKFLGARCLFTDTTLASLQQVPPSRRLGRVKVVNIEQPIDLYELLIAAPDDWQQRCQRYEAALEAMENRDLAVAHQLATKLVEDSPEDKSAAALVHRIGQAQQSGNAADTAVWVLSEK